MAKTLILNIDRDDDFGRKAQVKSPIIGVQNNLDAANKIGLADAEDSDLNAIFFAISIYESLKKEESRHQNNQVLLKTKLEYKNLFLSIIIFSP